MRTHIIIVAMATLAGCKTAGDIRDRQLFARSQSERSVDAIAGCVALKSAGRQIEIGSEKIARGISVTSSIRVAGIKTVTSVVDIEDLGPLRQISIYTVNRSRNAARPISGPLGECL